MMSWRAAKFVEKYFLWTGMVYNNALRNQRMIKEILYNSPYIYKAATGSSPNAVSESFFFEDGLGNRAEKVAINSGGKSPYACGCESEVGWPWDLKTIAINSTFSMNRRSGKKEKNTRHGYKTDTPNIETLNSHHRRLNGQSQTWVPTYQSQSILLSDKIGRTIYGNSAPVEKRDCLHWEEELDSGSVLGVNHPIPNNPLYMSKDQRAFREQMHLYSKAGSEDSDNDTAVENIYSHLSCTLGDFFKGWPDFSLHNQNVVFENSLFGLSTRGLRMYQLQVILYRQLCKILLTDPCLRVLKLTREPGNREIRIRWQVSGSPRYLRLLRRSRELRFYDFFSVLRVGPGDDIDFHLLMRVTPSQDTKVRTRLSRFFGLFGLAERHVHPGDKNEKPIPVIPSSGHTT